MIAASRAVPCVVWRGAAREGVREIPEETPVAVTFNRVTHAVMMATPADLQDFAVGFALSEEIVGAPDEIEDYAEVSAGEGIELRLWIGPERMARLDARRRRVAGVTGCGMCGLESLAEAMRPSPPVPQGGPEFTAANIRNACQSLGPAQDLHRTTHAVHAAGFWTRQEGLIAIREDVGRHNALDKIGGHLARNGRSARDGVLLLTSRISVELVQKASRLGCPVVAAISAPTALAVRAASDAGITLVGIARQDGFEVFTHPGRVR